MSTPKHPWYISPAANHLDASEAVKFALAEYERLFGYPLVDDCVVDPETGELLPVLVPITDNGGSFRVFPFHRARSRAIHVTDRWIRAKDPPSGRAVALR